MKTNCLAYAIFVMLLVVPTIASDNPRCGSGKYCKQSGFGACRTIRGRYGIYVESNGIIEVRTKRLLSTAGDGELDQMIYDTGGEFDHELLGDFTICPMSKLENPINSNFRDWQTVCVQSYKNTRVVKRQ